jgi:flagellar hook assembly protein FlgD
VPFQVEVLVYNSAGEVVKHVYEGGVQQKQDKVSLSSPSIAVGAGTVSVLFLGILASGGNQATWDGTNDSGQYVSAGEYYFKVQTRDQFGRVTAAVAPVTAMPQAVKSSLQVFNSAGELVATLKPIAMPPNATLEDFSLESPVFAAAFDPVTGAPLSSLKAFLKDNLGNIYTVNWTGRNDRGLPVASGTYVIQMLSTRGGGQTLLARQVEVLATAPKELGQEVFVAPNPAGGGDTAGNAIQRITVYYRAVAGGGTARARVYDLAGQLVATGWEVNSGGALSLDIGALSSGIYFVEFEILDGNGIQRRKVLRLAVVK